MWRCNYSLFFLLYFVVFVPSITAANTQIAQPQSASERNDPQNIELSDENLVIVEVFLEQASSGQSIEVYQHDGGFFMPLDFIMRLIDFPININSEEEIAQGWFIEEGRTFLLDVTRGEVVIEGKKTTFSKNLVQTYFDEIYVDSSLFSKWFPIDIELNFSRLALILKPRETLPIIAQRERAKERAGLSIFDQEKLPPAQIIESPFSAYSTPFADIDLGHTYSNRTDPQHRYDYALLMQGDVAYATGRLAVLGDSDDDISSARFTLGRSDANGDLLGGNATEFYVGDINAISVPLASSQTRGRGVVVSNIDLDTPDQFDTTTFIGDSQPGWEVELYRNGSLLDVLIVGDDGRYVFEDVEIFFGNNIFRIVSYGPQGQIREETKTLRIDNSLLPKGEFRYEASVDHKSRSLFGIDEEFLFAEHDDGIRAVLNTQYGLTDRTTATLGTVHAPIDDGNYHHYQVIGLRNSTGAFLTSLDFAYDHYNKGWASELSMNTSIKEVNVKLRHQQVNNFQSEEIFSGSNPRTSTTSLNLDGQLALPFSQSLGYGFGIGYDGFEEDLSRTFASNRLSIFFSGIGITNSLNYSRTDFSDGSSTFATGNFALRGRLLETLLRLTMNYQIEPTKEITSVGLSAQRQIFQKTDVLAEIRHDLVDDNLTSGTLSVNKSFKYARASAVIRADDDENYSIGTRLSFSVGREPRSGKWMVSGDSLAEEGAVSAQAYLDNNYNSIFDAEDELLTDTGYTIDRYPSGTQVGDATMITNLDNYRSSRIGVDVASIEDPFWIPKHEEYSVVGRPGKVVEVDFPVFVTSEIEGTVSLEKGAIIRDASHVDIQLMRAYSGVLVAQTRAEFDGFFLFQKVIPGEYYLQISDKHLKKVNAKPIYSELITIDEQSDIKSGYDLKIVQDSAPSKQDDDVTLTSAQKLTVAVENYAASAPEGNWLLIAGFENDNQAQDYWTRTFLSDAQFEHLSMVILSSQANNKAIGSVIKVADFSKAQGRAMCHIANTSGYNCQSNLENTTNAANTYDPTKQFYVSLGQFKRMENVKKYWRYLIQRHSDILSNHAYHIVTSKDAQANAQFTLKIGGFTTEYDANRKCELLRYRYLRCGIVQ